ncbi:putative Late nodulin [Medicago truncatula]|uniref:Nodule Cysteine-Rich (NCR) secreted peptide n=1 Tax=Medicago truncatula TaxID=3880 RepID=G7K1I6_MEDTR|nr:Nodule Cysteine-Rich (NCR) secreted peptide [Medicago truncatula]RHN55899.1 putative Late nodulin [Medicago truncatula]
MFNTLTFAFVIILLVTLFLVPKNVDAFVKCETTDDCPKSDYIRQYECVNNWCRLARLHEFQPKKSTLTS